MKGHRCDNHRKRLLAVERLFIKFGTLTIKQIQNELSNQFDLNNIDRRSLYSDIAALTEFYNIETDGRGSNFVYILNEKN